MEMLKISEYYFGKDKHYITIYERFKTKNKKKQQIQLLSESNENLI